MPIANTDNLNVTNKTNNHHRIVMVGIPGVGKTLLLSRTVDMLNAKNKSVTVVSFGTMMLDVAKENGLGDRDQLRRLPITEQRKLQIMAAKKIASLDSQVVIIDTHAFVSSPEGYYPGLPAHVLNVISPTAFISVSAKPEEVYNRRMNDTTRQRDKITLPNIKKELDVQSGMISACAVITGSPVKHILNGEGKADEAVEKIIGSMRL